MPQAANPNASTSPAPYVFASAINRRYVVPYAAMLSSFRDHNPGSSATAFVMHYDLLEVDRQFLEAVCRRADVVLKFLPIPTYPFLSFATRGRHLFGKGKRTPPIVYAKAFLDRFLPTDIDRVICIDADIIVNGDMSEIRQMAINSPVMAAANIPQSHPHQFNSGFMLLDLEAWRRWRIADIAEKFLLHYSDALYTHDQHVLNLIFRNRWSKIDLKWNYIEDHYRRRAQHPTYTEAEILAARQSPVIVHYAVDTDKPWYSRCRHPRADLYRKYRAALEMLMTGLDLMEPQNMAAAP